MLPWIWLYWTGSLYVTLTDKYDGIIKGVRTSKKRGVSFTFLSIFIFSICLIFCHSIGCGGEKEGWLLRAVPCTVLISNLNYYWWEWCWVHETWRDKWCMAWLMHHSCGWEWLEDSSNSFISVSTPFSLDNCQNLSNVTFISAQSLS